MSKISKIFTFLCLCFLLCQILSASIARGKILLRLNHQFPETTAGSELDKWFAEQIYEKTKGEVQIQIFWSNALGEARDNLSLLRHGTVDMAAMSAGYFSNRLPLHAAPNSIPMALDNVCAASFLMKTFMSRIEAFSKEAEENGVRALFFHLLNPYLLVSKKPVTAFSDLKGMRIRTWGKEMPLLIEAAGAKPVPLFLPDIYDAMLHGVIDACPFSVDLVVSYEIYKLAKHITEVVLWEGPSWGLWISTKAWEKLSGRQREIFLETAEEARLKDIPLTLQAERNARDFLIKHGVTFHSFAPEELAKWKAASPDFFQNFVQNAQTHGEGAAAKKMVEIWKRIRKSSTCP